VTVSPIDDLRRRRRIRRIALIVAAPLLVLLLAFGAKVVSMYAFAYSAAASHVAGDGPGTVQSSRGLEWVNLFETYKAPYNLGVGLATSGDLAGARTAFEQALPLAPGLEQCAVRVNLAIVIERQGDAAEADGDRDTAMGLWQEALIVMEDAPEGCRTPEADEVSPDPEQNMEDTVDEEIRRLLEKLQDPTGGEPPPDQEPEENETPDQSDLENLQDQLDQGAEERDDYGSGGYEPGSSGTDRPW
jgi:tetratricopeptide (TPR) repeat protein